MDQRVIDLRVLSLEPLSLLEIDGPRLAFEGLVQQKSSRVVVLPVQPDYRNRMIREYVHTSILQACDAFAVPKIGLDISNK